MADLRDCFRFRSEAALAFRKLTRGSPGGQLIFPEVIMSRLLPQHGRRKKATAGEHKQCPALHGDGYERSYPQAP